MGSKKDNREDQLASQPAAKKPPAPEAVRLFARARRLLRDAARAGTATDRFGLAHLAALRVAAAVIAARSRASSRPRRLQNAWALLETTAPELAEWTSYFTRSAATRAAIDQGEISEVSQDDADEQMRAAAEFLKRAERLVSALVATLAS
ncbi:MAG: hypothetical protein JOZ81_13245 [Chloroflexi bacterium]|nr:hypothetical protein [Chloroflexota bacterium]